MEVIEYRVKLENKDEPLYIVPLGDVHYGNVCCDVKRFKDMVDYIKNKENCYTILMGDMCDAIMMSDKRFDIQSIAPNLRDRIDDLAMAQYVDMRDMLKPIKNKIIAAVDGNHGDTLSKKYHTDFDAWLYRELDVPDLGASGFVIIKFDREKFHCENLTIFVHHGWVSGRKSGGKINAMEDLAGSFDSDVYIMGHSHDLFAKSKQRISVAGTKIKVKKQYFAQTGSYLQTYMQGASCYAEKAGYPPQKLGSIKIMIKPKSSGNLDVHMSE